MHKPIHVYNVHSLSPSLPRNPPEIVFSVIANSLTKILSLACSYDLRRTDDGGGGDGDGGDDDGVDRSRSRPAKSAEHWSDDHVFGARARFHFHYGAPSSKSPPPPLLSVLEILSVATNDAGMYRCRVDFERAPTRNSMTNLTVVGK